MADDELRVRITAETEDSKKDIEGIDGLFGKLGTTVANFAVAGAAALGTFAIAMGVKAFNSAENLQKAVNSVAAETGATTSEMGGLESIIKSLYSQNFGESFQDLADKIGEVKKQTGLSGKELEDFTRKAIILSDVFGYDVSESTKAAKALMDQFGVSSDEAFNLLTQGAQRGIDKNGDMLDSITEYSVQFKKLGFDADKMFSTLEAGAKAGGFSIDVMGDAIKEFSIRSIDGSKASMGAFKDLGFNADDLTKKFAKGGDTANKSFYQVIDALDKIKDPLKQNAIGTALFGTMFEDLGIKAIVGLGNVTNNFDKTKKSVDALNAVKYNTFGEAMTGLGRQLEIGLLVPLGQKMLPILNAFGTWLNQRLPQGIAIFKQMADFVGGIFGPVFNETIANISRALIDFITSLSSTKGQAQPIMNAIKDLMKTLANDWKIYSDVVTKQVLPIFLQIVGMLLPALGVIFLGVIKGLQLMYSLWGVIWGSVGQIVVLAWQFIANIIKAWVNIISGIIKVGSGLMKGDWSLVWTGIKQIVKGALSVILSVVKNAIQVLLTVFKIGWTLALNIIKGVWTAAVNFTNLEMKVIKNIINGALAFITNIFRSKGANIKSIISNLSIQLANIFLNLAKSAYNWGKNFLGSFAKGLGVKISELKNMAKKAAEVIKNYLGFSSPTKLGPGSEAHKWAPNFMKMYSEGMFNGLYLVKRAAVSTAQQINPNSAQVVASSGSNFGNITVTGNSIVNDAMVDVILQKAIRIMSNRGRL